MLIDINFDIESTVAKNRLNHKWITEFDTSNGLRIVTEFPDDVVQSAKVEKRWDRIEAIRLHRGIYNCSNIENTVLQYSKWHTGHPWSESSRLMREVETATENNKEMCRNALSRELSRPYYGLADNMKQVMRRGRSFINSPIPYVLGVCIFTQKDAGEIRWHKWGQYIGRHKKLGEYLRDTPEIDNIVHFTFVRLLEEPEVFGE